MSKSPTMTYWSGVVSGELHAFLRIAASLGRDHEMVKMMGSLAWGRHNYEAGPTPTIERMILAAGALDGYHDALNIWARNHDHRAQQELLRAWDDLAMPKFRASRGAA